MKAKAYIKTNRDSKDFKTLYSIEWYITEIV